MQDLATEAVSICRARPFNEGRELLSVGVTEIHKAEGEGFGIDNSEDTEIHVAIRGPAFLHHNVLDNAGEVGLLHRTQFERSLETSGKLVD